MSVEMIKASISLNGKSAKERVSVCA